VVLNLTKEPELIDCANNGLESVNQYERSYLSASAIANNPDVDDAFRIAVDSPGSSSYLKTDKQQDLEICCLRIMTPTALISTPLNITKNLVLDWSSRLGFLKSRDAHGHDDGESLNAT